MNWKEKKKSFYSLISKKTFIFCLKSRKVVKYVLFLILDNLALILTENLVSISYKLIYKSNLIK